MLQIVPTAPLRGLAALVARSAGDPLELLIEAFLADYGSAKTRSTYRQGIDQFCAFVRGHGVEPLEALRVHVSAWVRDMEAREFKPRTICNRITAVSALFAYLVDEEVLDRDPTVRVKRPRVDRLSPRGFLTRGQLHDLIAGAQAVHPTAAALIMLLGYNGLRIGEVCSLDVASMRPEAHHTVLTFTRKGAKEGRAVLPRRTEVAIEEMLADTQVCAAGRARHPKALYVTEYGTRMNQKAAQRIIDQSVVAGRLASLHVRISPHVLRHTWATLALAAGVPPHQVQHDGGWVDARMLDYYTHGQEQPFKAASHSVAAFTDCAA